MFPDIIYGPKSYKTWTFSGFYDLQFLFTAIKVKIEHLYEKGF